MTALAKATLGEVDPTGKKWKVKLVKPGASQLGKAKYDMVVSEILGTLTTSESMFKYINLYTRHLKTFGGDGEGGGAAGGTPQRVYAVPRSTHQYFSVRSYDKAKLGAPLAAALEHATQSPEAARKVRGGRRALLAAARRTEPPPLSLSPHAAAPRPRRRPLSRALCFGRHRTARADE